MAEDYTSLIVEKRELIRDMLRSPAWGVFMQEIVQPIREQIDVGFRELKPSNQADGPVLAGKLKLLDMIFYNVRDYI